jgi:hypothetical protein
MKVTEEEWTTSKACFVDSIFDYRVDTVLWLQNSHRYAGVCLRQRKEGRKEGKLLLPHRQSIRRFQNGKGYTTASFSRSLQLKKAFTARNATGSRLRNAGARRSSVPKSNFVNELALLHKRKGMIVADTKLPATSRGSLAWSSSSSIIGNENLHHFVIALAHTID